MTSGLYPEAFFDFIFRAKTIITLKDNLWVDRVTVPTDIDESNCDYKGTKYEWLV